MSVHGGSPLSPGLHSASARATGNISVYCRTGAVPRSVSGESLDQLLGRVHPHMVLAGLKRHDARLWKRPPESLTRAAQERRAELGLDERYPHNDLGEPLLIHLL